MRSRRLPLLVLALALVRLAPLSAAPDAWQQYSLELINRARASGAAEAARLGLSGLNEGPPDVNGGAWTIQNTAQPLAWNDKLAQAAQGHAANLDSVAWLFNSSSYGDNPHAPLPPFPGAPGNEASRISATGYVQGAYTGPVASNGQFPGLENVGYFAGFPADGWGAAEKTSAVEDIHAELFVDDGVTGRGHRTTLMLPQYREVGLGVSFGADTNAGKSYDAFYAVQNFGIPNSTVPFLTGVVYNDTMTVNQFYTPGEGLASVKVQAIQGGTVVAETTTFASGGYTLPLAAGTYSVRLLRTSDNATASLGNATIAALNVKLDSRNPVFTPSLTPVPVPAAFSKIQRQGDGSIRLEFTAAGVASPKIYASRTLAAGTWTLLGTATGAAGVGFQFTDTTNAGMRNRFYRVFTP